IQLVKNDLRDRRSSLNDNTVLTIIGDLKCKVSTPAGFDDCILHQHETTCPCAFVFHISHTVIWHGKMLNRACQCGFWRMKRAYRSPLRSKFDRFSNANIIACRANPECHPLVNCTLVEWREYTALADALR